jgi:RNA polymerase sigma-70 factor (ECF subfamily)
MDEAQAARLHREADAGRWNLPPAAFAEALTRSAAKAFAGRTPAPADLDRYLSSLHLADLALASACALGLDEAWDHFVAEFRPALYRAADAVDPSGGAREVADSLYAELYGLKERDGERQSLFRYFHGRSSLATWLRSLVAQRHVDAIRQRKRLVPLPEEGSAEALPAALKAPDTDRRRFAVAMNAALGLALAALAPRDRLRLGCYYARGMSLAQIGRVLGGHEATVSRQLLRTRRAIRAAVEERLRRDYGFSDAEITECFASLSADAEAIDLTEWLRGGNPRKKKTAVRSMEGDPS